MCVIDLLLPISSFFFPTKTKVIKTVYFYLQCPIFNGFFHVRVESDYTFSRTPSSCCFFFLSLSLLILCSGVKLLREKKGSVQPKGRSFFSKTSLFLNDEKQEEEEVRTISVNV